MQKYQLVSRKGEGAFSEVLMAQSITNSKFVAIKCMKNYFESKEQVNNLREIQALRKLLPHAHIVKLIEVLFDDPTGRLALVFELMDQNLFEMIQNRKTYLTEQRVKLIIYQLLKAIAHMHKNGIFHRDIKPENILISEDTVKLADFGSCRGIYSKPPYTEYISTRWYRSPECLLTDGFYSYKMDIWGVGCVMFEILTLYPLFPGKNELDQINKIHNILGSPSPELIEKFKKYANECMNYKFQEKQGTGIASLIKNASPDCIDIIEKMLAYDPDERLNCKQCLQHPFFADLREQEKLQSTQIRNSVMTQDSGVENNNDNSNLNTHNNSINNINLNNHNNSTQHINTNLFATLNQGLKQPAAGTKKKNNHKDSQMHQSQQQQILPNILPEQNSQIQESERMFPELKTTLYMDGQKQGNNANNNSKMNNFLMDQESESENLPPINKQQGQNGKNGIFPPAIVKRNNKAPSIVNTQQLMDFQPQATQAQFKGNHQSYQKKMHEVKKHYISPYSQKSIIGSVQPKQ